VYAPAVTGAYLTSILSADAAEAAGTLANAIPNNASNIVAMSAAPIEFLNTFISLSPLFFEFVRYSKRCYNGYCVKFLGRA
jgi:hypothetical protein